MGVSFFPKALRRVLPVKSLRSVQLYCIGKVDSEMRGGMHSDISWGGFPTVSLTSATDVLNNLVCAGF